MDGPLSSCFAVFVSIRETMMKWIKIFWKDAIA